MPETLETLAVVYAEHYDRLLSHSAELLLWDWREAAKIADEARSRLEARRAEIEANAARHGYGVLLGAVCGTFTRLAVKRKQALGYDPPETEAGIQSAVEILEMSEEWAAAERAERDELLARIDTLPVVLRAPATLWLDDSPVPESLGWYVRVALGLLGRRKAAA